MRTGHWLKGAPEVQQHNNNTLDKTKLSKQCPAKQRKQRREALAIGHSRKSPKLLHFVFDQQRKEGIVTFTSVWRWFQSGLPSMMAFFALSSVSGHHHHDHHHHHHHRRGRRGAKVQAAGGKHCLPACLRYCWKWQLSSTVYHYVMGQTELATAAVG